MKYPKIGFQQYLLLAGIGLLLCTFAGAISGCGSNESPSSSRKDAKPAMSAKPLVKEVRPESHPGAPGAAVSQILLERGQADAAQVIPPEKLDDFIKRGSHAKPIDPELVEVIPPDNPSGRGMTAAEFKAAAPAAKPIDPGHVEVFPPDNPGGRGMTVSEMDAANAIQRGGKATKAEGPK